MDLPNLRKKPTYGSLLSALQALEVQPNLWNKSDTVELSSSGDHATIQRFLMSIIASDLEWFQDPISLGPDALTALEQKEILFDIASRRVAERCGRSGKISVPQNRPISARCITTLRVCLRICSEYLISLMKRSPTR